MSGGPSDLIQSSASPNMIIRIYDIDWDTDGELPEKLDLPNSEEVELDVPDGYELTDEDLEDVIDTLSDRYGYAIVGYDYEAEEMD